ncbi:MAG: ABC transporter ATP-binding protein [Henriciella sp.]|nr:ABC transporter ATP-binding protein [Henriciella sp.]
MTELVVENLTFQVRGARLVDRASYALRPGELVVLLGPNGAGKSSLIRTSLGLQTPTSGRVTLGAEDVVSLNPMQRAQRVSYLPQIRPMAWPNHVRDVVALGRFSHGAAPGRLKPRDAEAVDRAIKASDLAHLADRPTDTLSGGELARVHCARAFAAEAPLLIADEPTAALDPRHQFRVMDMIQAYVAKGRGALIVLHDVRLAARYASRLIWMKNGQIIADGPPVETLTAQRLEEVYGVKAKVDNGRVELESAL